jgi:ribokinase|tara:strand:+ start:173731 stop:174618 length:888 start_codon:yes stop_codon:yes gene_type:complete
MDMTIYLERIPKVGETILGGEFLTCPGGKGANQAVAAARAGADLTFVGRLGADHHGDEIFEGFKADDIDTSFVVRDSKTPTGVGLIFVAETGENSIGVASGANAQLSPDDVVASAAAFETASVLLLQLEVPLETVVAAAELAREKNVRLILNPAPAQSLPDSLMRMVSILTPNETEAELLTGIAIKSVDDAERAASALRKRGVETIVLTLGDQGAFVSQADGCYLVPAFAVAAVDTVAAGDVFNGALAVALAEGSDLKDAVRFANAAAAHSVTVPGAQLSAPKRSEIEAVLNVVN